MNKKLFATILIFGFATTAQATFVADSDLKDWLNAPLGNGNDWKAVISPNSKVAEEDYIPNSDGFLSPGYGGQAYDAEAIYVAQDAVNFYVAVLTGLSPSTTEYPAGDLAFDFGNDKVFEYGVVVKSDTQTNDKYNGGIGTQGQVYQVNKWNLGLWDSLGKQVAFNTGTTAHPTTVSSGNLLGLAQLSYGEVTYNGASINQLGAYTGTHYLIEAIISKSLFTPNDLAQSFTVHWTMACANDFIEVDPPISSVPAPTILSLISSGLLLFAGYKKSNNLIV